MRLQISGSFDGQRLTAQISEAQSGQAIANMTATYANGVLDSHIAARNPRVLDVTDDGDVQRFHSGDFSVAPAQGSGMQALKNPAGAGFKKIVLDQAAGVMLDACAPFGPWVNS